MFVPFVPPAHTQASPLAQELGRKIVALIREFEHSHPGMSNTDIRQAIRIAQTQTRGGIERAVAAALIGGLVLLAGLGAFFLRSSSDPAAESNPMIAIAVAGLVVVALAVMLVIKR